MATAQLGSADRTNQLLQEAKRPIIISGNGINLSNCSIYIGKKSLFRLKYSIF